MKKGNFRRIALKLACPDSRSATRAEMSTRLEALASIVRNMGREEKKLSAREKKRLARILETNGNKAVARDVLNDGELTAEDLVSRAPKLCYEAIWRGLLKRDTARRMMEYRVDLLAMEP